MCSRLFGCDVRTSGDRFPYQATAGFDKKNPRIAEHSSHPSGLTCKRKNHWKPWPSGISLKRLFRTWIGIWCFPSSRISPRRGFSRPRRYRRPSMSLRGRRTWWTLRSACLRLRILETKSRQVCSIRIYDLEREGGLIMVWSHRVQREETRGPADEREVAARSPGGFGRY